ncbi:esterase E4-like [Epargyreus clarus]|uniref:esterase E4-like n=1 Tax=Epargyreus clarus TaxID=520877 RepID=UPI003C2C4754
MISAVNDFLDDLRGGRMSDAPVVRVEQGELQGRLANSPSGKAYYSFQGIPYAKPPLGSLRFKAPQEPESWEGIRDASSEGNISAQLHPENKEYIGDENCLFLNVYTPNIDGEFLPVMVFIHGGGFRYGSGSSSLYGGHYLVEKDVVVVTINYRCGALGFLSLNTPEVPGNAGLKDIVQAIRWVKQNIGSFGGNSGNITVFGQSAGGVAASILAASPLTKNLISKVIIQSGVALNSWAFQKDPVGNARKLADALGCESGDVDEILEFLSTTPVKDIVEAYDRFNPRETFVEKGTMMFTAVVEKEFPGVESVLTEPFIDVLSSGRIANVPIMIGANGLEFTRERSAEDLQTYIPAELHIERNSEESLAIAAGIRRLYFKDKSPTGVESIAERFELLSDILINVDTHRFITYLVKVTNKPIYFYNFDYVGELNTNKNMIDTLGLTHAAHGDELGYLFKNDAQKGVEPTSEDVMTRERMLRLWTNFVKTGNPTPDENKYITVTWQPVTKDNLYCLKLGNELSLITNPNREKMEYWEELYTKFYRIWDHPRSTEAKTDTKIEEIQVFLDTTPVIVQETVIRTVTTIEESGSDIQITEDVQVIVDDKDEFADAVVISEQVDSPKEVLQDNVCLQDTPEENVCVKDIVAKEIHAPEVVEVKEVEKQRENGVNSHFNGNSEKKPRPSNEIKMVQSSNGYPKDVIRANDPPEDDLPKNIGVNKFVNFFESLGAKK